MVYKPSVPNAIRLWDSVNPVPPCRKMPGKTLNRDPHFSAHVEPDLQLKKIILVSAAVAFISLGLGVSIGYNISPGTTRTTTITKVQTISTTQTDRSPTTVTQTVPTTITVVASSGEAYRVYTVTEQTVQVLYVLPECVTTSGQVSTTTTTVQASTTVIFLTQTGLNYSSAVSFTTVTNSTFGPLFRTQSESISC
jgi:hypothetical protein